MMGITGRTATVDFQIPADINVELLISAKGIIRSSLFQVFNSVPEQINNTEGIAFQSFCLIDVFPDETVNRFIGRNPGSRKDSRESYVICAKIFGDQRGLINLVVIFSSHDKSHSSHGIQTGEILDRIQRLMKQITLSDSGVS